MWLHNMEKYDWNGYLDFSKKLLADNRLDKKYDEETVCRVAISRAYYAAYHAAFKFSVSDKKFDVQFGSGSHDSLILAYKEMKKGNVKFQTACRTIGNILSTLKKSRVNADYHETCIMGEKMNYYNAHSVCKKVGELLDKINDLALL